MGPRQNAHFTINLTNLSIASAVSSFTFQQQFFDYLALYLLKYSLDQRFVVGFGGACGIVRFGAVFGVNLLEQFFYRLFSILLLGYLLELGQLVRYLRINLRI